MIDAAHATGNPILWTSQWIRHFLPQVSLAITSTVLAVFGGEINCWVKSLIKRRPFLVRVSVFVLLVTFGYGALNIAISHLVSRILMKTDDLFLAPIVVVLFIIIGVIAEEKRQI